MTMKLKIPETSVEYVVADVTSPSVINSAWPVQMAIISRRQKIPGAGDWLNAEWENDRGIRLLIGPGTSLALPCGEYAVWVKVNAAPETAVRYAGTLEVI